MKCSDDESCARVNPIVKHSKIELSIAVGIRGFLHFILWQYTDFSVTIMIGSNSEMYKGIHSTCTAKHLKPCGMWKLYLIAHGRWCTVDEAMSFEPDN